MITINVHVPQSPAATLSATPENFVQIMLGQLDAQRALLTGKLKKQREHAGAAKV